MSYTKGPWSSVKNGKKEPIFYEIEAHEDAFIWDICMGISNKADARLIAAAPEMLELLIAIRKNIDKPSNELNEICELDKLIAKAKGGAE